MNTKSDITDSTLTRPSRRGFLAGAAALAATPFVPARPALAKPVEIVHWSWLAASDGEVWAKMIDAFNTAHASQGIKIRMEIVPEEQYVTKILASVASGKAPDFGWGTAGKEAALARDEVIVPLDDLAKAAGLDLPDFSAASIQASRYPKYGNGLFMVPMDLMSLQPLLNLAIAREAGLDGTKPPTDAASLMEWARAMTKTEGGKVTRSGLMMTGSGVQPTVTWGIIAAQMGFRRASDDLKTAAVNPDAGKAAMQWVLDLFDKEKVSTRDVTDRYKAFGTGQGGIFWTGPWTLNGYLGQKLDFTAALFPNIGGTLRTYSEIGGLELYAQADKGRYEASMQAVKWLSDNSFLWTTVGRGASPRTSILSRPDYKTAGAPWSVRGPFVDGMSFATEGEIPVVAGPDFTIYSGGNFLAKTLDGVWAGKTSIDQAMAQIQETWQRGLDEG
ncbi:extracellular solute-binding protein [Ancylobacter amanitiformis]|uniref:ABC-type glycerol-3-phosphate transport system substrate-binding protein n=1 Tax=Ancylobacter amanitiformis TaxID=217069 RepID=A0ABU0LUV0_9HYPH|nr:extracellular solute-binding protein [Ancylobacter amanitiformis]MDQ0512455.1 ABC-type glycerol-3-phosphate transport system substrate-binding protein [Ancylobacter amanitiformis]